MDVGDIYALVAANFGGVLALIILLLYLASQDHVVGGQRYREMVTDRDYWRTLALEMTRTVEPRVDRITEAIGPHVTSSNGEPVP